MDVKGDKDAAWEGAGPSESPSQLRAHMNLAASLGHKVFPASRPPEASPREARGHRAGRPGPHRTAALAPCNVCQDGPACTQRSSYPHTAGSAWHLNALRGQGPAGRPQPRAQLASAPSWSGPRLRQAEARGRSAAGPGGTIWPGRCPQEAQRQARGRGSPTTGRPSLAHPGRPHAGRPEAPWAPAPCQPPSTPGNSGGFQAQTPRAATPAGPGALTFTQQLGSQATVLLGLPFRRNRLWKRSIHQSHSTKAPQSMGITPTSEPAHQGRRTRHLRPVRTPMTRAARGEASAHNRPRKLHGNPPTSRLCVCDLTSGLKLRGFQSGGPWGP